MLIHSGDSFHLCDLYNKIFARKDKLIGHMQTHFHSFTCEICSKSFARENSLVKHTFINTGDKNILIFVKSVVNTFF